jgi:hypothetical protein
MRYLIFFLSLILLTACSESTSPETIDINQSQAEAASVAGTESSMAVDEVSGDLEMVNDIDNLDLSGNGTYTIQEFAANFAELTSSLETVTLVAGKRDSVEILFEETVTLPNGVVRVRRLTYDWDSGIGHIQEIRTYPADALRALAMDSSDVTVDMGTTPYYSGDDQFQSAFEYRLYREDFQLESYTATYTLNDVDQDFHPRDFTATIDLKYRDGSLIASAHTSVTRHRDHSGEFHKEIVYNDGKKLQIDRTYNADGTGTLHRLLPSGIEFTGTFNILWDDNVGGFTRTTTFPEGFKTSKIEATGDFQLSSDLLTLTGTIVKIYSFSDGTTDTVNVAITQTFTGSRPRLLQSSEVTVSSSSGISSSMNIIYSETDAKLTGWWTTADGHYVDLDGYQYFNDLSILTIKMYESKEAKDSGDAPLATGVFETQADGSGVATITVGEEEYTYTYDASGRGKLSKLNRAISTVEAKI